jgi:NAD(P)-dependent dehydrogenase (short-subunit alcohol dehydrogenase family)
MRNKETVVVTGASQGIGAAIVRLFLSRGYRVVATSRSATKAGFAPSADLAVVDGDIGSAETAENVTQTAVAKFGSIDHVVSVTTITASLAENPIAGITASIPMITKGGLEAITLSLSSEYAKNGIRFNAVAPGVVDTPLHQKTPKDFMKSLSPMGTITDARDVAEAVIYLTEAHQVTGEVLHVDGGAHAGRW